MGEGSRWFSTLELVPSQYGVQRAPGPRLLPGEDPEIGVELGT